MRLPVRIHSLVGLLRRKEPSHFKKNRALRKDQPPSWPFYVHVPGEPPDPVVAFMHAGTSIPSPVIEVDARAIRTFPFGFREVNPFVGACCLILKGESDSRVAAALREEHYRHEFKSAAKVLFGLSGVMNEQLDAYPAWGAVLPWQPWGASEAAERNAPDSGGWQHGGPVTQVKLMSEVTRYREVLESIQRDGYAPDESSVDGHVGAQALVHPNRPAAYLVSDGNHKLAALLALNSTRIPIALRRRPAIVRRSEVNLWPNVRTGLFEAQEALEIFDNLIAGSANLDRWTVQ